jgi:drug/metabolite transporter (DMT)-like permease
MKLASIIGILLVVLGVVALTYQGFTFWTTERAAEIGPFAINVEKPHTIVFHPVLGVVALIAGAMMLMGGRRRSEI